MGGVIATKAEIWRAAGVSLGPRVEENRDGRPGISRRANGSGAPQRREKQRCCTESYVAEDVGEEGMDAGLDAKRMCLFERMPASRNGH